MDCPAGWASFWAPEAAARALSLGAAGQVLSDLPR